MPRQRDVLLRNEPSQIRSRKRRQNILAAATHLLEEIGLIAERQRVEVDGSAVDLVIAEMRTGE